MRPPEAYCTLVARNTAKLFLSQVFIGCGHAGKCRAADVIEMELLTGSQHLTPLDEKLPWLVKTNADIYALLVCIALLFVVLPFLMVPLAGVVLTLLFLKSRSR